MKLFFTENQNTIYNFPLFWIIILVEILLLSQNDFLKDTNLGRIFIKMIGGNLFTGICFSLEKLTENHKTNIIFHYFVYWFWSKFFYCCKIISSKVLTLEEFSLIFSVEMLYCVIYFSLEILIENHNTMCNFPLVWLIVLVQMFILQNHFLKDINLGRIFIKMFEWNIFTGVCFSLEILTENHNTM